MKTAPIMAEMSRYPNEFDQILVHTGQHYDANMSEVFFDHLGLRKPEHMLDVGSGTHAEQTAKIMLAFEPILQQHKPSWVVVVGDVNSSVACALVAAKLSVPVAHVEAGLRSGDRGMPEEINRILTDQLADLLFTPSPDGDENLIREGVAPGKIHFVGNVMIDTLLRSLSSAKSRETARKLGFTPKEYAVVTLHRPANVDDSATLSRILRGLALCSKVLPVLFPVHPRTRHRISELKLEENIDQVHFLEPLGYLDFLSLTETARVAITDSGGLQEETCFLGIPCLTVRPNTERPVTIQCGTNRLVQADAEAILLAFEDALKPATLKPKGKPERWDGCAAARITEVFRHLNGA
jgi:UDP-N-acetylglucosamine 2-epimerase (non-hydrolysing)